MGGRAFHPHFAQADVDIDEARPLARVKMARLQRFQQNIGIDGPNSFE